MKENPHSDLLRSLLDQVERRPDEIAFVSGGAELTFARLLCYSSQLAGFLNENGVGSSDNVLIRGEKNIDTVVAIYAVLMASAIYVPVDKSIPADLVHRINKQAAVTTILADNDDDLWTIHSSPVMWHLNYKQFLETNTVGLQYVEPPYPIESGQLAYIMFKCGSGEELVATAVSHGTIINALQNCREKLSATGQEKTVTFSGAGKDALLFDIFMPAFDGCSIALTGDGRHIPRLPKVAI